MVSQHPVITIYSRVIDNVTQKEVSGYQLLSHKSNFHFGTISGIEGGESPLIVELDIWNNEPAFYGGMYTADVLDATDCTFRAWDNSNLNTTMKIKNPLNNRPYVLARCVTRDFPEFKPIAGKNGLAPQNLYGSVSNDFGILKGQHGGDHIKVQTKISIPPNTTASMQNFVFEFSYNFV